MINLGIVGFIKILRHNEVDKQVILQDNYIELESDFLKDFHKYYFNYFMDKNDIVKIVTSKCERVIARIKADEKVLKDQVKWIKDQLKSEMNKVKKIDEKVYEEMKIELDKIATVKKVDQIDVLQQAIDKFIAYLSLKHISEKITLNRFKNILSSDFFGQISIYNVVNNSLTYEEHLKMMYRDYLLDIVESGYIQDYINSNDSLDVLKEHIDNLEKEIGEKECKSKCPKYDKIKKYYLKNNDQEKVKEYIREELGNDCTLCGREEFLTSDYTEGNFIPLAMSTDNALNFFYNQNAHMPICSICKLMLFCIPAGVNEISKIMRDYDKGEITYKEKTIYNFVNFDTDVETLIATNINFGSKIDTYHTNESKYQSLILDIVHQKKKISEWELSNIFIIEFDAEYRAHSRIEYFNIPKYVAKFFTEYAQKTIDQIKSKTFKLKMIDCILKNSNMVQAIQDNTRNVILQKRGYYNPYESYLAIRAYMYIKMLKKGGEEKMEKEYDKKLRVLYHIGVDLHEIMVNKKEENKLTEYSYKMLNSIKAGNKNDFMDIVIRLHMCYGKDVSKIFLDVMKEGDLDFESIGHSFLAGFISKKYIAKTSEDEVKLNEGGTNYEE